MQRVIFLYGEKGEFCPPVSQYSPNTPLSRSVVQQKNGSIKSWSSQFQVTPRKWVLKTFFFFFLVGWDGGSQTGLVFKERKWKLCFLMSCLSGCLCVWWSVKCSVTLTKWLSLCVPVVSNGLLLSSTLSTSVLHSTKWEGRHGPSINTLIAWRAGVIHSHSLHTVWNTMAADEILPGHFRF